MWKIQILGKDTNKSKSHAQRKYREECFGAYLLAFGPENFLSPVFLLKYTIVYIVCCII